MKDLIDIALIHSHFVKALILTKWYEMATVDKGA